MARTPGETQLVEQEQWLRSNRLPLVVPPTRRLRGLVPRTAPLLVTLALPATGLVMVDAAVSAQDGVDLFDILRRPAALSAVIAAGLVIVLAIPLGIAYAALQRRMTPTARLVVGQHGQLGRAARRPRTRRHRDEVRVLVNDNADRATMDEL